MIIIMLITINEIGINSQMYGKSNQSNWANLNPMIATEGLSNRNNNFKKRFLKLDIYFCLDANLIRFSILFCHNTSLIPACSAGVFLILPRSLIN